LTGPHLVADISAHGFGHLAQTAPILNTLRSELPALNLTVRSGLAESLLRRRILGNFLHVAARSDFGMAMRDALTVDVPASACRYAAFHRNWRRRVAEEARLLGKLKPDLLLSNVAYLPLAGAGAKGMSAMSLCSLNWADIYEHYCGDQAQARDILEQMREAYGLARYFLGTTPGMPMQWLKNKLEIGPVALLGRERRAELRTKLGVGPEHRLALLSLGGIDTPSPTQNWPKLKRLYWLVPAAWPAGREDVVSIEELGLSYLDLLASVDLLITKPGYGAFVEAAAHRVPVLYLRRHDWPEEPFLISWLQANGCSLELDLQSLSKGDFEAKVAMLLDLPRPPPPQLDGVGQAVSLLREVLGA
jgi:hypothetical protein